MTHNAAGTDLVVWIVEDDRHYRETMEFVLSGASGISCPRTFVDGETAVEALCRGRARAMPNVLLLDIHLPGETGIALLPAIREAAPEAAVVMLTIAEEEALIFKALQAGASGYLIKDAGVDTILEGVRQAAKGGTLMPSPVAERVLDVFRTDPADDYGLTNREHEVLQLMTEGLSQKQIAERLFLSPHTVNTHVQHIYAKLQVNSGLEAVAKAVRERLV